MQMPPHIHWHLRHAAEQGLGIANWIKGIARSSRHSLGGGSGRRIKVQFAKRKPKNNSAKHTNNQAEGEKRH